LEVTSSDKHSSLLLEQEILTEGECSVRVTSSYCFYAENILFLFFLQNKLSLKKGGQPYEAFHFSKVSMVMAVKSFIIKGYCNFYLQL
jgi:hypothetical protein